MQIRTRTMLPLVTLLLPPLAAQSPAEAAAKPTAASAVHKAVTTAKAKNKRALIAFLGDDALSVELDTALRKDRTLQHQLLYEFAIARADARTDGRLATERGADLDELGTPAMLVLDGEGCLLAQLNKNAFWSDQNGFEPETLHGLLQQLHAQPLDAEAVLTTALAAAKKADKNLLLHFDAPW